MSFIVTSFCSKFSRPRLLLGLARTKTNQNGGVLSLTFSTQNESEVKTTTTTKSDDKSKIGFIGTGKIAQTIIQAIIKKGLIKPENVYASDTNKEYLAYLRDKSEIFQVRMNNDVSYLI